MRNIVMICSLLLATASVSAQITFWGTSRTNMYDAETQTWIEDTIISFVADQYDYNEIDMISTIQEEWGDEEGSYPVNYFCLWKNGQKVNENQIYWASRCTSGMNHWSHIGIMWWVLTVSSGIHIA